MTLSYIFLVLIIYSFGGWVMEVIYTFIVQRRFINHGFLYGPLCPIYGAGAFLTITVLKPFSGNMFLLAFAGMVSATALEYATSWFMEKLFRTRWWDYSKSKFNLNGRVCLENTIAFGVISVVIVRFLQPLVNKLISLISPDAQDNLALTIFIIAFVDFCITLVTLLELDKKIHAIKTFADGLLVRIEENMWFDPYNLKQSYKRIQTLARDEKSEERNRQLEGFKAILKQSGNIDRLFNSFPKMKNHSHDFTLAPFIRYQNIKKNHSVRN